MSSPLECQRDRVSTWSTILPMQEQELAELARVQVLRSLQTVRMGVAAKASPPGHQLSVKVPLLSVYLHPRISLHAKRTARATIGAVSETLVSVARL